MRMQRAMCAVMPTQYDLQIEWKWECIRLSIVGPTLFVSFTNWEQQTKFDFQNRLASMNPHVAVDWNGEHTYILQNGKYKFILNKYWRLFRCFPSVYLKSLLEAICLFIWAVNEIWPTTVDTRECRPHVQSSVTGALFKVDHMCAVLSGFNCPFTVNDDAAGECTIQTHRLYRNVVRIIRYIRIVLGRQRGIFLGTLFLSLSFSPNCIPSHTPHIHLQMHLPSLGLYINYWRLPTATTTIVVWLLNLHGHRGLSVEIWARLQLLPKTDTWTDTHITHTQRKCIVDTSEDTRSTTHVHGLSISVISYSVHIMWDYA